MRNPKESRRMMRIDQYLVDEKIIGQGGNAVLYKVRKEGEPYNYYALKQLANSQEKTITQDKIERFRREATICAAFEHPSIVKVFDLFLWDGYWYLVMEMVFGSDLGKKIKITHRDGFQFDVAIRIIEKVAIGLKYSHQRGVIHRDIKPSNIMMDANGDVKIVDFGLATKWDTLQSHHFTKEGTLSTEGISFVTKETVLGTPDYIAAEQVNTPGEVSEKTDVCGLMLTLYTLLTGKKPFPATDLIETLYKATREPVPLIPCNFFEKDGMPLKTSQSLVQELNRFIQHGTEKKHHYRIQSMDHLLGELSAFKDLRGRTQKIQAIKVAKLKKRKTFLWGLFKFIFLPFFMLAVLIAIGIGLLLISGIASPQDIGTFFYGLKKLFLNLVSS